MSNSSNPAERRPTGKSLAKPGNYEIQDIEGTIVDGGEEDMRRIWMNIIEGNEGMPTNYDELKLVEVKAVIHRD